MISAIQLPSGKDGKKLLPNIRSKNVNIIDQLQIIFDVKKALESSDYNEWTVGIVKTLENNLRQQKQNTRTDRKGRIVVVIIIIC